MKEPETQKERLLLMLKEINDQLEEMELVLQSSYSGLRLELHKEEIERCTILEKRISKFEQEEKNISAAQPVHPQIPVELKLGF